MTNENTRIGEKFMSNEGCEFIIVEYVNSKNVIIEFQDEYKVRVNTTYQCCRNGEIKNPYYKSIRGVACLGLLSDGTRPKTKGSREYSLWHGMITRCYSERWQENNPTYRGCKVCDRWLIYANFLKDIKSIENYDLWINNPNQGIALDKDIKQQGIKNKVYSLETVCFATIEDNNKECIERRPSIKVYGVNIKTGEKTKIFRSISEAERELGINNVCISRCVNGKIKKTHGYRWYKVEENLD